VCNEIKEAMNILKILTNDKNVEIIRILTGFGPKLNKACDLLVNYSYRG